MSLPRELQLNRTQEFEQSFLFSIDDSKPRVRRPPEKLDNSSDTPTPKSKRRKSKWSPVLRAPSTPSTSKGISIFETIRTSGAMSQRNRGPRDRQRNTGHDTGEESLIWNEVQPKLNRINELEAKSKEVSRQIIEMEQNFKTKEANEAIKPSPAQLHELDQLYRANVKYSEESKGLLTEDLIAKITILKGLVAHNEQEVSQRASNSRDSHSRSVMDLDGSVDSPGPSPAENKRIGKLGAGRHSSQPPRDKEKDTTEPNEPSNNSGRTKITFALGQEVAFKPKIPNQTEEHDWIQGIVVKVIGEGKSRRYDVQDPFPDDPSKGEVVYRSSASSMIPIPPPESTLGPFEVGKQVLALYPGTSSFYRAEVKSMMENGSKVELLFEDDVEGMRLVDRQFVLDHKG